MRFPEPKKSLPAKVWALRLVPLLGMLWLYKRAISPFLPPMCRFEPTCSEYMFEAIKQRGLAQGIVIGGLRLCRCHPFGGQGYDPVEAFRWPWQAGQKPPEPPQA
jgi:hypothetical protein